MDYISKYEHWLNSANIDEATRNELLSIKDDNKEIKERFFCEIGKKRKNREIFLDFCVFLCYTTYVSNRYNNA